MLDSTPAAITTVMAFIVVIWYGAAVYLNSDVLIDKYERQKTEWNFQLLVSDSWSMPASTACAAPDNERHE